MDFNFNDPGNLEPAILQTNEFRVPVRIHRVSGCDMYRISCIDMPFMKEPYYIISVNGKMYISEVREDGNWNTHKKDHKVIIQEAKLVTMGKSKYVTLTKALLNNIHINKKDTSRTLQFINFKVLRKGIYEGSLVYTDETPYTAGINNVAIVNQINNAVNALDIKQKQDLDIQF